MGIDKRTRERVKTEDVAFVNELPLPYSRGLSDYRERHGQGGHRRL